MIVVLSVDGVCCEDLHLNKLPNLKKLAEQGIYTKRLRTVFPSVTWSIHTSVITGKTPGQHGVLGNAVYSRGKKAIISYYDASEVDINAIRQQTIFESAAAKGKISAAICWPLTQGSHHIQYNIPECYRQTDFNDYSTSVFVDEILKLGMEFNCYADWSCSIEFAALQDDLTCRIMEYLIERKPVDVLFAHFLINDSFQHYFGNRTPESEWSLRYADGLVGRVINSLKSANLFKKSHIIVFSDHGHEAVNKYFLLEPFLKQQGIPAEDFHNVSNGGTFFLYHRQSEVQESLLARLKTALEEHEAIEFVCTKEQSGKLGFKPQMDLDTFPDIIAGLNQGWILDTQTPFRSIGAIPARLPRAIRSTHGYLPETHPLMDGFMIRSGERFQKGINEESGDICDIYKIADNLLIEE